VPRSRPRIRLSGEAVPAPGRLSPSARQHRCRAATGPRYPRLRVDLPPGACLLPDGVRGDGARRLLGGDARALRALPIRHRHTVGRAPDVAAPQSGGPAPAVPGHLLLSLARSTPSARRMRRLQGSEGLYEHTPAVGLTAATRRAEIGK